MRTLETTADLAKAYGYPVVLVVGMRVGCLNHMLLTINSIRKESITLAGWIIANAMQREMPFLNEHIEALKQFIPAPLLGIIPYLPHIGDLEPSVVASYIQGIPYLIP